MYKHIFNFIILTTLSKNLNKFKLWDSKLALIDEGKKKSEVRKNQTDKIKALKNRTKDLVDKIKAETVESKGSLTSF